MYFNVLGFGRNLYAQSLFVSFILFSFYASPISASGSDVQMLEGQLRGLGFEEVSVAYASEGLDV